MDKKKLNLLILVASLGYFVDIFDLVLFNVIKIESLQSIGLSAGEIKQAEISLFNFQMTGMLLGGLIWGILGDKLGRVSTLFGSIIIYSVANIANAFVETTEWYGIWRFVAGFGLAGELGAGITLVSESMKREKRGIGTMIIVSVGALGAVGASIASTYLTWKGSYILGGLMGLCLLILRFSTFESSMFSQMKSNAGIQKGNFFQIFSSFSSAWKYIACILVGLPIWFAIGVMINLSHRYAEASEIQSPLAVSTCVMYAYVGLSVGDILCGILSQYYKSRKRVIFGYLVFLVFVTLGYHLLKPLNPEFYKWMSFLVGISSGYWALFVTNSAEQFGTNIRATVANTVPNFVRFGVVPITLLFGFLAKSWTIHSAGLTVGMITIALAFIALFSLKETFNKDLNYYE